MPADKEMNQDIDGDDRIGCPRGLDDSETRGDGKHWCQWPLSLASRKQGATRLRIRWRTSRISVKFSSTGFEFPFRHCSVSTSWSPKCCPLPFPLSLNPHRVNRLSRLIYRCGSYAASSAKRSRCLHGWKRARGRMQEGSTPSAVDLSIKNGKVKVN